MKRNLTYICFIICFVCYIVFCGYEHKKQRIERERIEKEQIEKIANHMVGLLEQSIKEYNEER